MASKAKWKRRAIRSSALAEDARRLADQYQRANADLIVALEFHRARANELQQAPVMTDEQKVDVEAAYQRGLNAGRAQNVELEKLTGVVAKELNSAYFAVTALFDPKPDEEQQ